MKILSMSVTLFLIMDPFGNLPILISILDKVPVNRRRRVLVRELFIAMAVIVGTIFCGSYVMEFLGLKQESVSIAGGIILFIIALRMVFPARSPQGESETSEEPLIVPIAIPLVAGPSLLAVLMLFAAAEQGIPLNLLFAASSAWLATLLVLLASTFLMRFLTKRGLVAVERLMGMVLIALAVQLILEGIKKAIV